MTQNELYLVLGANGLVAFTMLLIGLISLIRVRKFLSSAVETKGVVCESVYKGASSKGGGSMYSPKIKFSDSMGKENEFTENWSTNRPDFKVGDEVIVYYDPQNPHKARRGGKKWKFYFVAWLFSGLGILFSSLIILTIILLIVLKVKLRTA